MGWYEWVDKKLGGVLPGGVPRKEEPAPVIAPQKSTELNKQPPAPPMTITFPSGQKVTPTPVTAQKPSQFTPVSGGTTRITPTPTYNGGGSSIIIPYTPQKPSSVEEFRKVPETPFKQIQQDIQQKQTKSTTDLSKPESYMTANNIVGRPIDVKGKPIISRAESEADVLRRGSQEFFGGQVITSLKPYQQRGTAEITKITPYTEKEIAWSGSMGAGIVLAERRQKEFDIISSGESSRIRQDIGESFKGLKGEAEVEMSNYFGTVQSGVTGGIISLESGTKMLESKKGELELKYEKKGQEIISTKEQEYKDIMGAKTKDIEKEYKTYFNIAKVTTTGTKLLESAPLIGGAILLGGAAAPLIAGTTTEIVIGTGMGIYGAVGATKSLGKAFGDSNISIGERGIELGKGAVDIAFMGSGFKLATFAVEKSIVKGEVEALSQKGVIWDEVLLKKGEGETMLAVARGTQVSGGLKTEFNIAGKVLKQGESGFIMPSGKGIAKTSGVTEWDIMGKGQGTIISAKETFEIGSKGVSFEIGGGKIFGTMGKGTLIPIEKTSAILAIPTTEKGMQLAAKSFVKQYDKNLVKFEGKGIITDYFGGVSVQAEKDLFYTRGGKIVDTGKETKLQIFGDESLGLYKSESKEILSFGRKMDEDIVFKSFQNKDLGRVRILEAEPKATIEFGGVSSGMKGNLPEETVRLFTGTTKSGAKGTLETGLQPSKGFKEVYLVEPKDIEFAKGFGARKAVKTGEELELLEANIPKSVFEELKIGRATGKGGMGEVTLKNVPKEYLSIYKETPIEITSGKSIQLLEKPKGDLLGLLTKQKKEEVIFFGEGNIPSSFIDDATKSLIKQRKESLIKTEFLRTPEKEQDLLQFLIKQKPIETTGDYLKLLTSPKLKYQGSEIITKGLIGEYSQRPVSIYYGKGMYERTEGLAGGFGLKGLTGITILEPSYKTEVQPVFLPKTKFDLGLESKPLTKFRTTEAFYQPSTTSQGFNLDQNSGLKLETKQLQALKLKQITPTPMQPFTPNPSFDFKTNFRFGGGFTLPKLNIFEKGRTRQSKGRKFGYTPSIVSLGFKGTDFAKYFTATKEPKGFLQITGIYARPLIKSKKRKKRR